MNEKPILDACCGSRMFWFDKENPNVEYCDKRTVPYHEYYPGRYMEVKPDTVCDFTNLPFKDKSYKLVVFDPPHLTWAGETSWTALKYGRLENDWPQMIHDGFWECMRVLDDYGVLIFKWSEAAVICNTSQTDFSRGSKGIYFLQIPIRNDLSCYNTPSI